MSNLRVWKYPVPFMDEVPLDLPHGAEVLSVQMQGSDPVMWAIVNPKQPTERRTFWWIGTGNPVPDALVFAKFIGTVQMRSLVFHLFEASR